MKNKNIIVGLLVLLIVAFLIWYFGFRSNTASPVAAADTVTSQQAPSVKEQTGSTFTLNTVTGADGKKQEITTFFTARDSAIVLDGGITTLPSLKVVDHETEGDQLYFQLPMAKFNNYDITFVLDNTKTLNATIREENSSNPGIMMVSNAAEVLESLKAAKNIEVIVNIQSKGKKSLFFSGPGH